MNSSDIIVVKLTDIESAQSGRLEGVLDVALKGRSVYEIHRAEEMTYFLKDTAGGSKRLLFAVSLGKTGINLEYYRVIQFLRNIRVCWMAGQAELS